MEKEPPIEYYCPFHYQPKQWFLSANRLESGQGAHSQTEDTISRELRKSVFWGLWTGKEPSQCCSLRPCTPKTRKMRRGTGSRSVRRWQWKPCHTCKSWMTQEYLAWRRENCLPLRLFCRVLGVKTRVSKWVPPGGKSQLDLRKNFWQCQEGWPWEATHSPSFIYSTHTYPLPTSGLSPSSCWGYSSE